MTIFAVHVTAFALGRQSYKLDPLGNSLCAGLQHVFARRSTVEPCRANYGQLVICALVRG